MRSIALAAALLLTVAAAAASSKPKVPAGVDPGGIAVALVGNGVDYTRPAIARRLARDGEGEIVGWDFVAADRLPWSPSTGAADATLAEKLAGIERLRLIPLKIALDGPDPIAKAIGYAARAGARIIIVEPIVHEQGALAVVAAAAARFSHIAFIAARVGTAAPPPDAATEALIVGTAGDIAVDGEVTAGAIIAAVLRELPACVATGAAIATHPKLRRILSSLELSAPSPHPRSGSATCAIRSAAP